MATPVELPIVIQVISSLSGSIAVIFIPIILAVVGNKYTRTLKEKEIQAKFVELALDQLKIAPNIENQNIRKWAVEIINRFSGIHLTDAAKSDLINKIGLVSGGGNSFLAAPANPLESEIFSKISAGKQLGLLAETLLDMSRKLNIESSPELVKLRQALLIIEQIKSREKESHKNVENEKIK